MFYGLFQSEQVVKREFQIDHIDGKIIFAAYEYEDYSGAAEVVLVWQGKFWQVSGGHCSCMGLEGQWEPELMPYAALSHIAQNATYGLLHGLAKELQAALNGALAQAGVDADTDADRAEFALRLAFQ